MLLPSRDIDRRPLYEELGGGRRLRIPYRERGLADACRSRPSGHHVIVQILLQYRDDAFEHFLKEYGAGARQTPISCVREIKFRAFLDYATQMGAELIATGHYVQTDIQNGRN